MISNYLLFKLLIFVKLKKSVKNKKVKPVSKTKTVKPAAKVKKVVVKKSKAKAPVKKATKKVVSKKVVSKKVVTKKVVKKALKKKPVAKAVSPKKVAVKKVAPKKSVSKPKAVSKTKVKIPAIKVAKTKTKKEEKIKKEALLDIPVAKPRKKSRGGRKPKNKDDDDDPSMDQEQDILIEQLIQNTKNKRRGNKPKVPKQIRTFTNPKASLNVVNDSAAKKKLKEPKGKFEIEYVMRTSPGILYEFLTSPSGLSEWFADDVNIHEGVFTFFWDGSEQKAKLLGFKEEKFIKFRWLDKLEGTFFEFRIERDELTGDISLIVTDFADEESDKQTSKLLWDSQINDLLNVIGSY